MEVFNMAEKRAHRRAKTKAAGTRGRTEVRLPGNRRLDALSQSRKTATEVERSPSPARLVMAAERLKQSGARRKVLQVPQTNMDAATKALQKAGIAGTVKNMGGTKRRSVRRPKR